MIAAYTEDHPRAWLGILAEMAPDDAGVLRSTYGRQTIEEIAAAERHAVRLMTFEEWREGAARAQASPARWVPTTRERYHEMLEVLPPIAWTGGSFLVGEPVDHCFATGRARFQAFRESPTELCYCVSSRAVTRAELEANRGTPRGEVWR